MTGYDDAVAIVRAAFERAKAEPHQPPSERGGRITALGAVLEQLEESRPTEQSAPPGRRRAGDIEKALRRDLKHHEALIRSGGRETLAALALRLARLIDGRGDDGPTTTAKLFQELKSITVLLLRKGDGDDGDDESGQLPAPAVPASVRNAQVA